MNLLNRNEADAAHAFNIRGTQSQETALFNRLEVIAAHDGIDRVEELLTHAVNTVVNSGDMDMDEANDTVRGILIDLAN